MSSRDIGGYLELERFDGRLYHENAIALSCGRACIEYLVELRGIRKVWVPDWMCDSVTTAFVKCGVEAVSYCVGSDMRPIYDFEIKAGEWLYLMDYYGQLATSDVDEGCLRSEGRLVVDEAQGFFRKPWSDADVIYTCRKFFGVSDGAYLYTFDGSRLTRSLLRDESHERMGFVLGRFERPANEFFAEAKENNNRFEDLPAMAMSPLTENILRAIDYERVRIKRDTNFAYLDAQLREHNMLEIVQPQGAFMYPLLVENASGVREAMAKRRVFIPVLWPNVLTELSDKSIAARYSFNILPLPVDQRYEKEEMQRVLEVLWECL